MNIVRLCVIVFAIMEAICTQHLELLNLYDNSISVTKLGKARLQTGTIKILHPINISKLEQVVDDITLSAKPEMFTNKQLSYTLQLKVNAMIKAFRSLKPRIRTKRWDALGSAWKWLAGTPDADDLRAIDKSVNQLITENNAQIKINMGINKKMDLMIQTVQSMLSTTKSNMERFELDINIINMIFIIDTLKKHLDDIHEAIAKAKINLVHQQLITEKELHFIAEILDSEGIILKIDAEAMQYITTKVVTNGDVVMYIISTPKLHTSLFDSLTIIPLINNNEKIHLSGEHFIKASKEILQIKKYNSKYIYSENDVINMTDDKCLSNIIHGKHSTCKFQSVAEHNPIKQISDTILLINDGNVTLESTCGASKRLLTGHFLVKFLNCSVTLDGVSFVNKILSEKEVPLILPLYNLKVNKSHFDNTFSLNELSKLHLITRKHIEHLTLAHQNHEWSLWSIFGGISTTMCISIFLVVYFIYKNKSKTSITNYALAPRQTTSQKEVENNDVALEEFIQNISERLQNLK